MRITLAAALALLTTPALAQFPPPGIYACVDQAGDSLGTISLLVAGDYQWLTADGKSTTGQLASASNTVEALTGPLAALHWKGDFSTTAGRTVFFFKTDAGEVTCQQPQ